MLTLSDILTIITVGLGIAALMSWVAYKVRSSL